MAEEKHDRVFGLIEGCLDCYRRGYQCPCVTLKARASEVGIPHHPVHSAVADMQCDLMQGQQSGYRVTCERRGSLPRELSWLTRPSREEGHALSGLSERPDTPTSLRELGT